MLGAAAVLGWMIIWMSRRRRRCRDDVGGRVAAAAGSATALFWLSFAIVVREGLETALFLFAAVGAAGQRRPRSSAASPDWPSPPALGYAVYRGGSRLNLRTFFTVLNVLLLVFGAYLVWRGVEEVGEMAGGELGEVAAPVAAAALRGTSAVAAVPPPHYWCCGSGLRPSSCPRSSSRAPLRRRGRTIVWPPIGSVMHEFFPVAGGRVGVLVAP